MLNTTARTIIAAFVVLVTSLTAHAQSSPPLPKNVGPTLEETVAFMNDLSNTYGRFMVSYDGNQATEMLGRSALILQPCTLAFPGEISGIPNRTVLDLSHADPLTLSITEEANEKPTVFQVGIGSAAIRWIAMGSPGLEGREEVVAGSIVDAVRSKNTGGVVFSVDSESITYLVGDHQYVKLRMGNVYASSIYSVAHDHDIQIRDLIKADAKAIAVGDWVDVFPERYSRPGLFVMDFAQAKTTGRYFSPAHFIDRPAADRYAKALIHAMAMCNTSAKPSLF